MSDIDRPRRILPLIILAQLLGTISWLAGNAILPALQQSWALPDSAVVAVTNSVQLGFIAGALLFALLALADRVSPRMLFFACTTVSAGCSLAIALWSQTLDQLLWLRFINGLMLAGIYPVGMKIATGWYPQGLGRALGYLVGALVLGTASPHLLSGLIGQHWQPVMLSVAATTLLAGLLVLAGVPDGPALYRGAPLNWRALIQALRHRPLQAAAGGYFGHMWELYAVWALAPLWLNAWADYHHSPLNSSLWTFAIIAIGGLGCILGGRASLRFGSRPVASLMLALSGLCCLLSPLMMQAPGWLLLPFWLIWGFSVVGDSPQLSTLSAQHAPPAVVGSALTLINCLGYSLTTLSVALLGWLLPGWPIEWLIWLLLPGPLLGLLSLRRLGRLTDH
ncbi:MFS transporter [Marinobacterium arenosum]|uniref:MFS transporter n=1 Tax=Marinobacterium arenosum TaxID=2862496 RepID=UPI001C989DE2|nr:MFS transporter [Marinobacterium arenosum]MBY4675720.1 MFS transporter [Marinobacterium arenosum]